MVRYGTSEPISSVDVELVRVEGEDAIGTGMYSQGSLTITISRSDNTGRPQALRTRTKADGRFRFGDLKPGTYRLSASHQGGLYCPAEYGQKEWKGPGLDVVVPAGENVRNANIEMIPPGTISGRVVDENGNPAGRVRVMAIDASWKYGKLSLGIVQALYTDDHGDYRLFWLPPGRYFIAARPEDPRRQNLTVIHFLPATVQPTREYLTKGFVTHRRLPTGETIEEVVEAVYHGGDTDPRNARAVDLASGVDVSGIDISLNGSRSPARRIRGVVLDATGRPVNKASVSAIPLIDKPTIVMPETQTAADGSFELTGVGSGAYVLRGVDRTPGVSGASGLVPISPGGESIERIPVVVMPGFSVKGRIRVESADADGKTADLAGIRLLPTSDNLPNPSTQAFGAPRLDPPGSGIAAENGDFTITGLYPGDYHMRVWPILNFYTGPPDVIPSSPAFQSLSSSLQNYYVKSIRLGQNDVLNDGLHVDRAPEGDFEVVLGANGGVLEGSVTQPGRGTIANVTVVLVPDGLTRSRPDLYKSVRSDRAGRYLIRGITPGDYRLFAFERIEDGTWFDPDFLRANRARGVAIHVVEGENPALNVGPVQP